MSDFNEAKTAALRIIRVMVVKNMHTKVGRANLFPPKTFYKRLEKSLPIRSYGVDKIYNELFKQGYLMQTTGPNRVRVYFYPTVKCCDEISQEFRAKFDFVDPEVELVKREDFDYKKRKPKRPKRSKKSEMNARAKAIFGKDAETLLQKREKDPFNVTDDEEGFLDELEKEVQEKAAVDEENGDEEKDETKLTKEEKERFNAMFKGVSLPSGEGSEGDL